MTRDALAGAARRCAGRAATGHFNSTVTAVPWHMPPLALFASLRSTQRELTQRELTQREFTQRSNAALWCAKAPVTSRRLYGGQRGLRRRLGAPRMHQLSATFKTPSLANRALPCRNLGPSHPSTCPLPTFARQWPSPSPPSSTSTTSSSPAPASPPRRPGTRGTSA